MRIKCLCHWKNHPGNVLFCFQYSYQEEQERPLRVPGTQCCKWPTKLDHSLFKQLVWKKWKKTGYVVITFLLRRVHIICATTCVVLCVREEWVQVHGLWKINSCIRFSEESCSQDVAVLQRLAQSANPAEPAVWCMWEDWMGNVGSVCAPFYGNLKESMAVATFYILFSFDTVFLSGPGNWSLWGDQQSKYTWSRRTPKSSLYVLFHKQYLRFLCSKSRVKPVGWWKEAFSKKWIWCRW